MAVQWIQFAGQKVAAWRNVVDPQDVMHGGHSICVERECSGDPMALPFLGHPSGQGDVGLDTNRNDLGEYKLDQVLADQFGVALLSIDVRRLEQAFDCSHRGPHPVHDNGWEETLPDENQVAHNRTEQLERIDCGGQGSGVRE